MSIAVVRMRGQQFSRAIAFNTLAEGFRDDALLIFMDVDFIVKQNFLFRAALNVRPGSAYFPIIFSKYSPQTVCYGQPNCTIGLSDFSQDSGFWRHFSFGLVAISAGDMRAAGSLNTEIVGWGKEDVDFHER